MLRSGCGPSSYRWDRRFSCSFADPVEVLSKVGAIGSFGSEFAIGQVLQLTGCPTLLSPNGEERGHDRPNDNVDGGRVARRVRATILRRAGTAAEADPQTITTIFPN